jgi:hypothetical protein
MAKQGAQPQQELDESVEHSTVEEAVDPSDTGGAEETDMATRQIKAMRHYLDGIEERVKQQGDMEEWFQNKLTKANDYLKSLYAYGKGDKDDEKEVEESYQVDESVDEATYGDTGWKKREGPRKDKFGNVIKPKNVAKHLAKQGATKAATQKEEQVDELSRKTLGSYVSKASDARGHRKLSTAKLDKRYSGVARASQKLDKKQFEEVELDEKTLTPAEKKKREEIAKAIERDNPKMSMDKKMAIATAQAKKVAESVSDRTKELIERAINRKT